MHGFFSDELLRRTALTMGSLSEGIAILIIAAAVFSSAWSTLIDALFNRGRHSWSDVRLKLGSWLALALEFLLAADVVRTAVAPTWGDIGKLASIAVIRTGLNYFLSRDIDEVRKSGAAEGIERAVDQPVYNRRRRGVA